MCAPCDQFFGLALGEFDICVSSPIYLSIQIDFWLFRVFQMDSVRVLRLTAIYIVARNSPRTLRMYVIDVSSYK